MKKLFIIAFVCLTASYLFAQDKVNIEPKKTSKSGVIVFKSLEYNFGVINYEAEAKAVFTFKNITKSPIKLTNVKASCGCTGTEWPREEIGKKKKGKITVTYNSKIVGKFNKTVYVYVEGVENPIQLIVKGEVLNQDGNPLNYDKNVPENEIKSIEIQKQKVDTNKMEIDSNQSKKDSRK
ncbi:MAG TPA: DUF1573 domain-containing protein [Bacteroidales bacterium]|nr:DUF1573 domain-containing protein [Bacteroidales bacterium]